MKESFYFPHDYEPTSDPKIQALLGEFGAVGYGVYWRIVEMLHSDEDHKLPFKDYLFLAVAKQMLTSVEQIRTVVDYCLNPCELLSSDSEYFWSNRVFKNIEKREGVVEQRRKAGKASAEARKSSQIPPEKSTPVEHPLTSVEQNSTKGNKGKERKEKKRDTHMCDFAPPSLDEVRAFYLEKGYKEDVAIRAFNGYDVAGWKDSNGKQVKNWKQKMIQVWFKPENKIPPSPEQTQVKKDVTMADIGYIRLVPYKSYGR